MRLRNKNWTKDYIEENHKHMILEENKIDPKKVFSEPRRPCFLEIGCGKGQFIINNSIKYPNLNFIAMEKESTVIGVALKKAITTLGDNFTNLKFLNRYAENLLDLFEPKSFDGIYLNFSDPWPKSKHAKKRLTHSSFLDIYYELLNDDGIVEIKTDNDKFYESSLEQVNYSKFRIIYSNRDIYASQMGLNNNIATEYEEKFHKLGKNIYKIILKK